MNNLSEVTPEIDEPQPSGGQVRAALERIVSDPEFRASGRRIALLRFIVEEALAGRGRELKGFTIATAVFDRDDSFDSATDPVVRLEARRLRQDLDSYYVGAGANEPIRISIPKGGYKPLFEAQPEAQPAPSSKAPVAVPPASSTEATQAASGARVADERSWPRVVLRVCLIVAVAVILAGAWLFHRGVRPEKPLALGRYPRIVIMPFTAIDSSEEARVLAAGLNMELVDDLRRFEGFRIYQPRDGSDVASVLTGRRGEPGVLYGVYGLIQAEGARAYIDASLHDLRTEEVIWSEKYDVALVSGAITRLRGKVASQIATVLGQPYGPIGEDLVRRSGDAKAASVESYLCVFKAYEHRRNFSPATFGPTLACLEAAVERDPGYSDAWAMLAWLHLDAGRFEYTGAAPTAAEYMRAFNTARRALSLEPDSILALKALSSIEHYRGRYAESERLARRAVDLNPHDPDALAQLAWRLAVRGKFDEGIPLLREAIDRSVDPPGWYFYTLAIDHLMRGEYDAMRREVEQAEVSGGPIADTLLAVAAGGLGDRETARVALLRIGNDWEAEIHFRRHGATDEIVATVMEGLNTARRLAEEAAQP